MLQYCNWGAIYQHCFRGEGKKCLPESRVFGGRIQSTHKKLSGGDLGGKIPWPHFVPSFWSPAGTCHWLNTSGSQRGRELLMQSIPVSLQGKQQMEGRWEWILAGRKYWAQAWSLPNMLTNNFCQILPRVNPNATLCCLWWLCFSLCIFSISRNGHFSLPNYIVFFWSSICSRCKNN